MEIGTGMTVTFGTSGTSLKIRSMRIRGTRGEADFSHAGSTGARDLRGTTLVEYRATISGPWDAETAFPITAAAETITLTYPSTGTGATSTYAGSGQLVSFDAGGEFEKEQDYTAEMVFRAAPTLTP